MVVSAACAAVGWQLAMVTHTESDGAAIGFKDRSTGHIPFAQMKWARPLRDDEKAPRRLPQP